MIVFRITKQENSRDLSGEGARLYGGRWNSPGRPMLYTATSRSLSLLEMLAHSTILPTGMVRAMLELPPHTRIHKLELADLPIGWDVKPHSLVSQKIGDDFLRALKFLALEVPSVIVSAESNVLINPLHPDAGKIKILGLENLFVDPRLK
ncbi:MAG: RES family NAD+ phosphorylase [Bacteroidetes bacterium]|nr:RES family NAD+ phosphorylase [Bacteroidota bacterium]